MRTTAGSALAFGAPTTVELPVGQLAVGLALVPLHGAPSTAPVPSWLVLVGATLGLWVVIACGVVAAEGLLAALEREV